MAAIRKDDIQEIICEVRDMLELRSDPSEAELQRLAKKYAAAVQQANSLLKTCLELVEKGLKLDAIARADENHLLEIVSILDFPEQPVWVDYLNQFGLSTPPVIDQFASRQINACYAPARRLEPLYRLNRRHALANSPLPVRLGVMRRIHKMEEATAKEVAGRQVELFETERLKSVRKDLADAMQQKDQRKLNLLCAELSSKDWLKAPDAGLVKNAARALRQEEARRARLRMIELAAQLQNMWSAQDVAGGRRIRDIWNTCQTQAQLTAEDPLIIETQAAFQWLQEIDEEEAKKRKYEGLVAQLREGLDQREAKEFLLPLEHALEAFEDGIPRSLQNRLKTWYDELETEARRKNIRRLVLTSLAVVGVASLLMVVLRDRIVREAVAGHTTALTTFLERGDVEAAEAYVETLRQEQPEMLVPPQIQVLLVDIEQARKDEDARLKTFENETQAIAEGLTTAVTVADAARLETQRDALKSRGATEEEEAERLAAGIEKKRQQIQNQNDDAFTVLLRNAATEFEDYEKSGPMEIKRIEVFRSRFHELAQTPDVSRELIAGSAGPKELVARCEAHIFDMNVQANRRQMLQRMTDCVGTLPAYRAAMDAFAKQFPKDPLSDRFENLLRTEADVWPQVEVQNKFVTEHSIDCTKLKPMEARKYLEDAEAFLITHPEFPRRAELTKIRDYLRFISQRIDAAGQPVHVGIADELERANLNDLFMVRLKTGQRYYTDKEPEILEDNGRVHFFPLIAWSAVRERQVKANNLPSDAVDIRFRSDKADWAAPESVLIPLLTRKISRIDETDWEKAMAEMLGDVFDEDRQHPIFRLFKLRTILNAAVSGSPVISQRYSSVLEELNNEQLDDINPFNPDDERTKKAAARASELLTRFENPANLPPRISTYREVTGKLSIGGQYHWIGWLNRTAAGWVCVSVKPLDATRDGRLLIYTKAETETPRFYPIGTVSHGKPTVVDASAFLAEGHPVYMYAE